MRKSILMGGAFMLCSLITFTSCDEVLSTLDNPVSPYLELQSNSTVIGLGETDTIKASTISTMPVYYVSSNPEVVTVDEDGVLTPVADGDATITVKVDQDPSKAYNPGETKFEVKVRTPLTFQALEDGQIDVNYVNDLTLDKPIVYTINGKKTEITTTTPIEVKKGDLVKFESANDALSVLVPQEGSGYYYRGYVNIMPQSKCAVYGNVMSMITDGDFLENKTITQPYALYYLLRGAYNWTDDGIEYYTLSHDKYKLQLPATQLFDYCYGYLLSYTGITEAPELPATELAYYCYSNLFSYCLNLAKAPKLPATTLAYGCYSYMFSQCDLTEAPELPAKELVPYCYRYMFRNNYNLTKAPKLPATTLANYCYQGMFQNCTALTSAPALPATTLANYCYQTMFYNCTSLTQAPKLPAMNLATGCYYSMFNNCTALTTVPALPATTLAQHCYRNMFYGCSSLTKAPDLPAAELQYYCYAQMFQNCSKLSSVKCLATGNAYGYRALYRWLNGAGTAVDAPTFTHAAENTDWINNNAAADDGWCVPTNWTIAD